MIDAHCHILPGIDDGAVTIEESLQIARASERDGIRTIFATPHVMRGSFYSTTQQITGLVDDVSLAVRKAGIQVELVSGAEVYPEASIVEDFKAGRVTPLGGTRFVLVEAPSSELPPSFEALLFRLAVAGARPIIAHPERNPSLSQDVNRLSALADRGLLLQVNTRSFTGSYGRRAQTAAEKMARLGIIGLLGTDAHGPESAAGLRDVRARVLRLGGQYAIDFIDSNETRLMDAVAAARRSKAQDSAGQDATAQGSASFDTI